MASDPVVFDQRAVEMLMRAYREQALEIQNLQRQLRALGVQRHERPLHIPLHRARLTMAMDDDNPVATARHWSHSLAGETYYATNRQVLLRSFLRPEGEEIPDRTRVYYASIDGVNEVIVANCAPDPEEETPP